jgi:hypothetical protein
MRAWTITIRYFMFIFLPQIKESKIYLHSVRGVFGGAVEFYTIVLWPKKKRSIS